MATVQSFEELNVWKESRQLANELFRVILSNDNIKDYALKDQINRASGSIMDNIAEGFERQGNKEFRQFLTISRGSCGEVKSQLYRALDRKYISAEEFKNLMTRSQDISKMIYGFIKYLNSSDYKGSKYIKEPIEKYGSSENGEL